MSTVFLNPLRKLRAGQSRFWEALAVSGAAVFAAEALYYARHQRPVIDEGTYLYKGLLFARGVYRPFQPNGPWMNHMPLSFLIPGYVQKWFGPGLDVGRYFSVVTALVMLVGLWALIRRLADRRWAAAAVWAFAAMPAAAKIYSLAVSQALAAAMFVWALTLVADEEGAAWRLAVGGLLAGVMVMTRLNMVIAWGLMGLFLTRAWPRRSIWFWGTSLAVILGLHALYWPRMAWVWARWLPSSVHLPPQFGPNLSTAPHKSNTPVTIWLRLQATANALAAFPLAWGGLFAGMAAWAAGYEKPDFRRRILTAGVLLAWALVLMHGWASVGKSYCVDCFTTYTGFYAPLMVGIGAIGLQQEWRPVRHGWIAPALAGLLFALLAAAHFFALLDWLSRIFRQMGFLGGYTLLRRMLSWPPTHLFPTLPLYTANQIFWLGAFLTACAAGIVLWLWRGRPTPSKNSRTFWLAGAVALLLLSPFPLLSGSWQAYDCAPNVLAAHRQAAAAIARAVPAGARVYWAAYPPTVLLRLQGGRVFPQQLNDHYNFRQGGDPQTLASWGYWNEALARQWLAQADVVITDEHVLLDGPPPPFETAGFAIRQEISLVPECLGRQGKLEIMTRSKP